MPQSRTPGSRGGVPRVALKCETVRWRITVRIGFTTNSSFIQHRSFPKQSVKLIFALRVLFFVVFGWFFFFFYIFYGNCRAGLCHTGAFPCASTDKAVSERRAHLLLLSGAQLHPCLRIASAAAAVCKRVCDWDYLSKI